MSVATKTRIALISNAEGIASTVGKLYTALPTDTSADPTVTRALDTATRINSSGNIETVVANKGRITFERDITKCPNLIVERTRTNLFLLPLVPATQVVTVVNATVYTVSIIGSGSITLSGAATGVVTESTPITITTSSTSLTCTVAGSVISASVVTGQVALSAANGTANADVISKTGISAIIPQTKGGVFADCYLQAGSLSDGILLNVVSIGVNEDNYLRITRYNNAVYIFSRNAGLSSVLNLIPLVAPFKNKRIKFYCGYSTTALLFYINGILVNTIDISSIGLTAMTKITIGAYIDNFDYWNGLIKAVAVTDELTESEIAQLSSYPSFSDMASEMIYETV